MMVIDPFEMIDVDEQQRQRLAGSGNAIQFAIKHQTKLALVGKTGKAVARRQRAQAVDQRLQSARIPHATGQRSILAGMMQKTQRLIEIEICKTGLL